MREDHLIKPDRLQIPRRVELNAQSDENRTQIYIFSSFPFFSEMSSAEKNNFAFVLLIKLLFCIQKPDLMKKKFTKF